MQDLLLRYVALYLLRKRHHPSEYVFSVFTIGMNPPRHPDTFHGTAFRFTAAVSPEYPAIAFPAFVKSDLLFMFLSACIVTGKRILPAARLFSLDLHDPFQSFFLLPVHPIASFCRRATRLYPQNIVFPKFPDKNFLLFRLIFE